MSVKNALRFVHIFRNDETLRHQILSCNPSPNLKKLVTLGAEMDLAFTVEDLTIAHQHDWALRWMLYSQNSKI